jgi:hypothetical protein
MTEEQKAEEYYYKTYPVTLNIGEEERKKEVTDIYLAGYHECQKEHEWHYVKDELPEKEKYVLIYTNVGNVYISRLVKDNYFINKKGGFVQTSAVIAWKEIVIPKEIE